MNIHKIALVRSTNIIPFNGTVYPISEIPYIKLHDNTKFTLKLYDMLEKNKILKDIDWSKSREDRDAIKKLNKQIANQYYPHGSRYNSMVLWAINGLVPDDINNTFSNKNCAIIDGLEEQLLSNAQIISLSPTDTAIKGKVILSNNSIILIRKKIYDNLSDNDKNKLNNLNVKLFDNNLEDAVQKALIESGRYIPEMLSLKGYDNGFVESETSKELQKNLKDIAEKYGLSQENHFNIFLKNLDNNYERKKSIIVSHYYQQQFFDVLFSEMEIDNEIKNLIMDDKDSTNNIDQLCSEIEKYGINKYKSIVEKFNRNIEGLKANGFLPTPQQIVDNYIKKNPIDLNEYVLINFEEHSININNESNSNGKKI